MTAFVRFIKTLTCIMALSAIGACTTASVEENLTPQPLAAETTQQTNASALASQTATTPSQNVTESQL